MPRNSGRTPKLRPSSARRYSRMGCSTASRRQTSSSASALRTARPRGVLRESRQPAGDARPAAAPDQPAGVNDQPVAEDKRVDKEGRPAEKDSRVERGDRPAEKDSSPVVEA